MDQMLEQVRHFASTTDKAGRKRLALALRDVSYALETPDDTTARITSYVSTSPHDAFWLPNVAHSMISLSERRLYEPASISSYLPI